MHKNRPSPNGSGKVCLSQGGTAGRARDTGLKKSANSKYIMTPKSKEHMTGCLRENAQIRIKKIDGDSKKIIFAPSFTNVSN